MEKEEMKKKGLDTLGWLVAFPVPVTKALTKRKGGKFKRRAATIAMTWAMYLGLATAGVTSIVNQSSGQNNRPSIEQVSKDNLSVNTDNQQGETDWNGDSVAEGQAAMECHADFVNIYNMGEGLPDKVYCVTKINGEDYRNDWVLAAGEQLTIETMVIDSRDSTVLGHTQYVYPVYPEDLTDGIEIKNIIPVYDTGYLETGLEVMATYTFSPKAQIETAYEDEIKVSVTDTGLFVGGNSIIVIPGKANREFRFSSSNSLVATVSNDGVIEGIRPGNVIITATEIATGKKGYASIWVGEPKWSSIYSYVTMEDGYLDESEWEVTTLVGSKIGFNDGDLIPGDTIPLTLRVKRKSDSAVYEKTVKYVVATGDYEFGFITHVYLPVTVNGPDGTEHTEYFYATFNCGVVNEENGQDAEDEIRFEEGLIVLDVGESMLLTSKMVSGAGNRNLKYASANPEAVTVDDNGLVTGVIYGFSDIAVETESGKTEFVRVYVAKQRNMKLTTKVVQADGEFNPEEWDVTLLINGEPCEEYFDAVWNEPIEYYVRIEKKGTKAQRTEVLSDSPSILSIIEGFQNMMTVTVSDGDYKTSFRVYFHFDGDTFKASNGLIFGKTGNRTLEIYCPEYYLYVGNSTHVAIEKYDGVSFLPDEEHPFIFESSDESVIKVDEDGRISAVGSGKAYLIVYLEETGDFGYTLFEVR